MSTVAAIVVTYNRPLEVFGRAFASILNQSRPADEVVVVYTGGDEVKRKCIETFVYDLAHDVRVLHTSTPATGAEGRNLGASSVNCEYLAFLDDDDVWYRDKLKSQMSCVDDSVALVVSPYDVIGTCGLNNRFSRFNRFSTLESILGENIVGSTSFPLIYKNAFDKVGEFDTTFCSNQEWDLWIRIIADGGEIKLCDEPAGMKYEMSELITSDSSKRMAGFVSIFRKHWSSMIKNPMQGAEAAYYWWTEAYRSRRPLNVLFALSLFFLFRLASMFRK